MSKAARRTAEGEWIVGTGWKESAWSDARFISREDLDLSCPKHPAVAHRVCGHLSSVNSKALELLGIDDDSPGVERNSSRRPTGILKEEAVALVRQMTCPDPAKRSRGLEAALMRARSLGVTSIQDNGEPDDLRLYRRFEGSGKLSVRVWFNSPSKDLDSLLHASVPTGTGSDLLKVGGLKVFCDGALGARTAALSKPYADDPHNTGMFVHARAHFEDIVARANDAEIQLAIHAIGDEGIEAAIRALESALGRARRRDHRHRIEHLELPSRGHLGRMRRLGIIASMQPNFIGEWGGCDGMYLARLGPRRTSRNNPFREVLDSKVRLVFGSDCMPFSPLYGIRSAVDAHYASQRLTPLEAFAAYTRTAAYASFEETLKGRIEEGMQADFAVLSSDPFVRPKDLSSTHVIRTVFGGATVYEKPRTSHG
jgi:hypothetical protein